MKRDQRMDVNDSWRDAGRIDHLIQGLPGRHVHRRTPLTDSSMRLDVYGRAKVAQILQRRFSIPDATQYSDQGFFESASELSIATYLKRNEGEGLLRNLEFEKKVNPNNGTDVDCFFRVGAKNVSIEIKCARKEKQAPFPENITEEFVRTGGEIYR